MNNEDAHTTLRLGGGGLEVRTSPKDDGFDFDGLAVSPLRNDPRYSLSLRTLGRMERLAKARFITAEIAPGFEVANLSQENEDTRRSIALSVFASSEVEGEGISATFVEAFVAAHTEPGEHVDAELRQRMETHKAINDTYFWALNSHPEPVLQYDFVLETHRRMFLTTKCEAAGRIKDKDVVIRWHDTGGSLVNVPTIPADRAEAFLRALCDRTNKMFSVAQHSAEASLLLLVAEFACDFLAIHPFTDGNGRLARLLSTYLLERGGYHFSRVYPLDQVVLDTRTNYYRALNSSQRYWHSSEEDLTPWINYFVGAVFEQWERAFRSIRNAQEPIK